MEMLAAIPDVWIWVALAVVLAIGEMMNTSFFMLPFAIGCAVAAVASLLGIDFVWQIVIVAVVGVVCLIAMRPFAKRVTASSAPQRSGIDRLKESTGIVVSVIEPMSAGLVKVGGEEWSAKAPGIKEAIAPGTVVDIIQVDGAYLIVAVRRGE